MAAAALGAPAKQELAGRGLVYLESSVLQTVRRKVRLLERAARRLPAGSDGPAPYLGLQLVVPGLHGLRLDGVPGDAAGDAVALREVVPVLVNLTVLAQQVPHAKFSHIRHPHPHRFTSLTVFGSTPALTTQPLTNTMPFLRLPLRIG